MERSHFWLSSWSVQRLGGFILSREALLNSKPSSAPSWEDAFAGWGTQSWKSQTFGLGGRGPIISTWGFILLKKKFLLCPSCILLLSPPLCYQVPLPSPAPRFQRSRLICTCTSLPLAEPTSVMERHPTHPVPHPRAAVAPSDLISTFHKTSQILLAFQL